MGAAQSAASTSVTAFTHTETSLSCLTRGRTSSLFCVARKLFPKTESLLEAIQQVENERAIHPRGCASRNYYCRGAPACGLIARGNFRSVGNLARCVSQRGRWRRRYVG